MNLILCSFVENWFKIFLTPKIFGVCVMLVWLLVDVAIGQLWSDCWAGGGWWCGGRGRAQQQPTGRWSQAGPATTHQDTGGMEAGARARDTHAITIHIPSHGDPHTMQTWKRSLEFHKY